MSAIRPAEARAARRRLETVGFWIGLALLLVLAAAAPVGSALSMMVIESCQQRCVVVGVLYLGEIIAAAGPAVVLIGTAVAGALLHRRGRPIVWIPFAGITLAIALVLLGDALIQGGAALR